MLLWAFVVLSGLAAAAAFAVWRHCERALWTDAYSCHSAEWQGDEEAVGRGVQEVELRPGLRMLFYPALQEEDCHLLVLSRQPRGVLQSLMAGYPQVAFTFFEARDAEAAREAARWACALLAEERHARLLATDLFVPMVTECGIELDREMERVALVDPEEPLGAAAGLFPLAGAAVELYWGLSGKTPFNEPRFLFTRERTLFPGEPHRYRLLEQAFVLSDLFPELAPAAAAAPSS